MGLGCGVQRQKETPTGSTAKEADDLCAVAREKSYEGNHQGVINDLTQALDSDPQRWATWNDRGLAKLHTGDFKGALADFSEALRLEPNSTVARNNRGIAKTRLGDIYGAIEDCQKVVDADPNNGAAWINLGIAKIRVEDWKSAVDACSSAIRLRDPQSHEPSTAVAYCNRGYAQEQLGDYSGAENDYSSAVELDKGNAFTWNHRASARIGKKDYRGAISDCNEALQISPKLSPVLARRSLAHVCIGDNEAAIADCREARRLWHMHGENEGHGTLKLDPRIAEAFAWQAQILLQKELFAEAIGACSEAIKLSPRLGGPWCDRAKAKAAMGNYVGALADCKEALLHDESHEDAAICKKALDKALAGNPHSAQPIRLEALSRRFQL